MAHPDVLEPIAPSYGFGFLVFALVEFIEIERGRVYKQGSIFSIKK